MLAGISADTCDVDLPAIVAVIHIVMDIIQPCLVWAAILASRASACGNLLDWGVAHRISSATAALTLEDMEQTKPVADLMSRTTTLIIIGYVSSGDAAGEDVAAILVIRAAAWRGVGRKIANSQKTTTEVGEKVDVKAGVGSLTESWFHLRVIVASCPIIVHGKVGRDEGEGYAARSVGLIQNRELEKCMSVNPCVGHSCLSMIPR